MNAKNNGENWEVIPDSQKEKYLEAADNSIKLSLILNKIRDNEPDAQLTDEEVFKAAKENITKFSNEPDKVLEDVVKNGHLPILLNRIRDEYTLSFIEKNCKIVE
jgi:FKBP-type peptidyl-prolyl cis-trans isomerase (trigger factor)